MIRRIGASKESFKEVEFHPGFNVVLAERSETSGERDSRNGSGKSSLIEIVHFLLGADLGRSALSSSALEGWTFFSDLTVGSEELTVSRGTTDSNRVWPGQANDSWPVNVRRDPDGDRPYLGLDAWKSLLGWLVFGVPPALAEESYGPTVRALLPYFARRGRDAFSDPFAHFRNQPSWNRQLSTSFLLGLDWEFVRKGELLRQREEKLRDARKAIEAWRRSADAAAGTDRQPGDLEGQLEAMKINLERRIREADEQLKSFQVHPQYEELEREASEITKSIHDLSNENVVDRELLDFNRAALEEERPADPSAIEAMYAEAEIYFSERLNQRLRDVQEFHQSVFVNRQAYLGGELERLEAVLAERDGEIEELSVRRAELLAVLQEHGALSEYLRLQERQNQIMEELGHVNAQLEQLRGFDAELAELRLQRDQHAIDARADFQDRRDRWSKAVDIFGSNTAELYEEPGEFALSVSDIGGLTMRIDIQAGASQGVQEMMVFCYDLMLAELWAEKGSGPGFLIHDSTIFDGVDERQVAKGLTLAERKARECGFQYICCMNSDAVPWEELPEGLDFRSHVRLELSDEGDDGGLFGMRF